MTSTTVAPPLVGRLTRADVEDLGRELDDIRQSVIDSRGSSDAAYIRRLIKLRRGLELGSRLILMTSRGRPGWVLGTGGLALAKVLDNMEIGHNVLHGQWDWMRDPRIHSTTWDWDFATPPDLWQRAHNQTHHAFTNIVGQDNDLGYGIMRVDEAQPWERRHLAQPVLNLLNALVFEHGIAAYDLGLGVVKRNGGERTPEFRADLDRTLARVRRQAVKELVAWPALSGRGFARTAAANVTANLIRNVWSHSVIMCGHFPEGVEVFEQEAVRSDESRGEWYLRQMLGSADITGPGWLHVLAGNLSHQIEHHLFPDLPSNRYAEIAPRVRGVFDRFGLRYHAAPLPKQVLSAWHRVLRLSLPDDWLAETTARTALPRLRELLRARPIAPAGARTAG
ncbi:acyl-CoA desaturase [Nocardioides bigeumensis]|uniref:Acyl-CoA desaturase n=1 Tax=Nocardioides bigeumensis TaxID=433657 RepID=A0ABN2Y332_9ACTN